MGVNKNPKFQILPGQQSVGHFDVDSQQFVPRNYVDTSIDTNAYQRQMISKNQNLNFDYENINNNSNNPNYLNNEFSEYRNPVNPYQQTPNSNSYQNIQYKTNVPQNQQNNNNPNFSYDNNNYQNQSYQNQSYQNQVPNNPSVYTNNPYQQQFSNYNIYDQYENQANVQDNYYPHQFNDLNRPYNPQFANLNPIYSQQPANHYGNMNQKYYNAFQRANLIPNEIAKEIKFEKFKILFMFIVSITSIIFLSIMIAAYYKVGGSDLISFLGFKRKDIIYPLFSIPLLIISSAIFAIALSDFSFLYSNVKRYERELIIGNESVPYFITRNYRTILSRKIYLTWICFSVYICGSISLGILYGLEELYQNAEAKGDTSIYFLFWKIGNIKSFKSEITTNTVILLLVFVLHISNIVLSRRRQNNIISYYGYEILPRNEITEIKSKANKKCLIIFLVCLAIILFVIVIPWLIIRKRQGKPLKPWGNQS